MSEGDAPIRLAVIGTGAISQVVHVPIFAERTDVDLAVLSDSDFHKAETLSRRFEVPTVMEPEAVFEHDALDAVVICTPNDSHEEMAVRALRGGKHVFVERPLAPTAAGVRRILEVAEEVGRSVVVGLPHRFRPEVTALRSFVAGGELGELYAVRGSWLTRRTPVMRLTWRHQLEGRGGALIDLGVPALDLCLWVVGYPEINRVWCMSQLGDHGVEESATLMFSSTSGVVFSVEVSNRLFAGEDRYYARVMGDEGTGSLPPLEIYKQLGGRPLEVTPRQPKPRGGENPYMNAYRRQLDHFVRVVGGEADAEPPLHQEALMRLVEAAYASVEAGTEVTI